jgi:TetR/AcrR family transcriptional regulator
VTVGHLGVVVAKVRSEAGHRERVQLLLDVGAELLQKRRLDDVRMLDIASAAGVAKGTVFLTFASKEALFLALLQRELTAWLTELEGLLFECRGIGDVVDAVVATLRDRSLLLRLLSILGPVLEYNSDIDTIVSLKAMLLERLSTVGLLLEQALPFLRSHEGARVFLQLDALVVGLFHQSEVSPMVQSVLSTARFSSLRVSFADELRAAFSALLHGIETLSGRSKSK